MLDYYAKGLAVIEVVSRRIRDNECALLPPPPSPLPPRVLLVVLLLVLLLISTAQVLPGVPGAPGGRAQHAVSARLPVPPPVPRLLYTAQAQLLRLQPPGRRQVRLRVRELLLGGLRAKRGRGARAAVPAGARGEGGDGGRGGAAAARIIQSFFALLSLHG